jgi:hypothetical protein
VKGAGCRVEGGCADRGEGLGFMVKELGFGRREGGWRLGCGFEDYGFGLAIVFFRIGSGVYGEALGFWKEEGRVRRPR